MKDIVVENLKVLAGAFAFGASMTAVGMPVWVTLVVLFAAGCGWDYYRRQQAMKEIDKLLDEIKKE